MIFCSLLMTEVVRALGAFSYFRMLQSLWFLVVLGLREVVAVVALTAPQVQIGLL